MSSLSLFFKHISITLSAVLGVRLVFAFLNLLICAFYCFSWRILNKTYSFSSVFSKEPTLVLWFLSTIYFIHFSFLYGAFFFFRLKFLGFFWSDLSWMVRLGFQLFLKAFKAYFFGRDENSKVGNSTLTEFYKFWSIPGIYSFSLVFRLRLETCFKELCFKIMCEEGFLSYLLLPISD